MLNSSSKESTVGLEADILLGERSIGLESPFIPPEDTRVSTIIDISEYIDHISEKRLIEVRILTSFLIVGVVTSVT